MPGFDKTGPMGAGPMTGGMMGYCNPAAVGTNPAFSGSCGYGRWLASRRGLRSGFGPGRGQGRGCGRGYGGYSTDGKPASALDTTAEIDMLRAQAVDMQSSLDTINKRIDEIEKNPAE